MKPWNDVAYQRITSAESLGDNIVVHFENGETSEVANRVLIPFDFSDIKWDDIKYNPFEIIVPAQPEPIHIPWDKIRVLTDKEFAKDLANRSEKQSKLIGLKIKRLREKKGIRSNELAERAGITPQTISRIEQGHTDVGFATLRKILASMGYSLSDLASQEAELDIENTPRSFNLLVKRLSKAGIDSKLLIQKIIPVKLQEALNTQMSNQPTMLLDEAASYVSNVYGWPLKEIWSNQTLIVKTNPSELAYFKKPSNANENQIRAYCHYAYYLAKIVLKTTVQKPTYEFPGSLEEFKIMYLKSNKELELKSLIDFVWSLGIAVLPLNDPGVFHGASWNIDGRHIIILKQNAKSHARWIFDLLHELYHVFVHLQKENTSVVELEELNPFSDSESLEELEANAFTNQVIFGDDAERLAEVCVESAEWKLENLKQAVIKISKKEKIQVDFLANYLAFRLAYQGQDWWATAAKMQISEPEPFSIATEIFKKNVQIQKLNPIDHNLLTTAISN